MYPILKVKVPYLLPTCTMRGLKGRILWFQNNVAVAFTSSFYFKSYQIRIFLIRDDLGQYYLLYNHPEWMGHG